MSHHENIRRGAYGVASPPPPPPPPDITTGLNTYWAFSGAGLNDTSGNGNNLAGTPSITTVSSGGRPGAYCHSGSAAATTVMADTARPLDGPWSVSAWFLLDHTVFSSGGQVYAADDVDNTSNYINFYAELAFNGASNIVFSYGDGNGIVATPAPLADGWHHAVATVGGGAVKLYIDGVLAATANDASLMSGRNFRGNAQVAAAIGLDSVAFYTRVLAPDQVAYLYNAGAGRDPV